MEEKKIKIFTNGASCGKFCQFLVDNWQGILIDKSDSYTFVGRFSCQIFAQELISTHSETEILSVERCEDCLHGW